MNFVRKHNTLIILFSLGLLLRLLLIFVDYAYDVNNHIVWGQDALKRGFINYYNRESSEKFCCEYPNYPPLAIYFFYLIHALQPYIINLISWLAGSFVYIRTQTGFIASIIKLPAVFADLGIAYVCYLFAKKLVPQSNKLQLTAILFILFNPAFFYNSALWGQIDAIPIFFILCALYLLFYNNSTVVSIIFFTASILSKPNAILYIPYYLLYFIYKYKLKNIFKIIIVGSIFAWICFLPFYKSGNLFLYPFTSYMNIFDRHGYFINSGAFNIWAIKNFYQLIPDKLAFFLNISYSTWGYVMVGIFVLLMVFFFLKSKDKKYALIYAIFIGSYATFLFLTKIHERYMLYSLPFLLLVSLKNQHLLKWFVVISLLHLLNLNAIWHVRGIDILKVKENIIIPSILAICNIALFFHLLFVYLRESKNLNVDKR